MIKRIIVVLIGVNDLKDMLKSTESMECPGSMLVHFLSGKRLNLNLVSDTQNFLVFHTLTQFIVDPMHNILLVTAKHLVTLWKGTEILSAAHFKSIQANIDQFITPADIGRIPYKVQSQFSSFTADQWKNWTLIYSIIVIKPILPVEHY